MDLVDLRDGSFLSFVWSVSPRRFNDPVKRWSADRLQKISSYNGYQTVVHCAIEIDADSFATGSADKKLRVFNKSSRCCIHAITFEAGVSHLLKGQNDPSHLLCLLMNGSVESIQLSDFQHTEVLLKKSVNPYENPATYMCELEDSTLLIVVQKEVYRWDLTTGTKLQTFEGHSKVVTKVIELRRDVIVSASCDQTVKVWRVSLGECLRTLNQHEDEVWGLVKLNESYFASGSIDKTIRVWDDDGNNIATYQTDCSVEAMRLLSDGSLAVGDKVILETRKP